MVRYVSVHTFENVHFVYSCQDHRTTCIWISKSYSMLENVKHKLFDCYTNLIHRSDQYSTKDFLNERQPWTHCEIIENRIQIGLEQYVELALGMILQLTIDNMQHWTCKKY